MSMERGELPKRQPRKSELCDHCALPVPAGLVRPRGRQFCCAACEQVYAIIGELGMDHYYDLRDRFPGQKQPAVHRGRDYAEFGDKTFEELYVREVADDHHRTELYLEGVHCAACIWLVERIPSFCDGVIGARLDLGRSRLVIDWDPRCISLPAIACRLDSLGYPPHPFRGAQGEAAAQRERRDLWIRVAISGAVAGNVMMISFALYGGLFHGIDPTVHRVLRSAALLVSIPALVWGGGWFIRSALRALCNRRLHIDLPVSIGIIAGYAHGTWNVLRGEGDLYLDSVTMLIFLLLAGRLLERGQQRRAAEAAELLHTLAPSRATRIDRSPDGQEFESEVPVEALLPGARLRIRAGETIPADGVVCTGRSELDRSLLTGESLLVPIGQGDRVEAGCTNVSAALEVIVEQVGEESRIGKLLAAMEESARRRAPVVRLADRIAGVFVGAVLLAAVATAVIAARIDPTTAIDRTLALLIVTCPCALALATPLAVSAALGRAARRGILVRGGDVFERLRTPGIVWFDKTGTLTDGQLRRADWIGDSELELAVLAIESESHHPLARAFLPTFVGSIPRATSVGALEGGGITGTVGGNEIVIGSPRAVLAATDATPDHPLARSAEAHAREGSTPVLVARNGVLSGLAIFIDGLRDDSLDTVRAWQNRGWQVGILSGDDPAVAQAIGARLGLDPERCLGGVYPEGKLAQIENDLAAGSKTVMIGDGVNDAAALAAATVGIAIGGGAEAALRAADAFVLDRRLAGVAELLAGAARVIVTIRSNLAFSLLYNAVGASLAIGGVLSPIVAAVLMPLSSLTVVTISWRARTFPEPAARGPVSSGPSTLPAHLARADHMSQTGHLSQAQTGEVRTCP